jgi:hypothetical protein
MSPIRAKCGAYLILDLIIIIKLLLKERLRHILMDNIKIYLKCESVDWIQMAQDRVQLLPIVNTVINLGVP